MKARCDRPREGRKLNFSQDLRVLAVHFEDSRCWILPEAMGQAPILPPPTLWRAPPHQPKNKWEIVQNVRMYMEKVAVDVARLSDEENIKQGKMTEILVATCDENADTGGKIKGKSMSNTEETQITQSGEEREKESNELSESDLNVKKKMKGWKRKARDVLEEGTESSRNINGKQAKGMEDGMATTGPGATGKLPCATECAWQEP